MDKIFYKMSLLFGTFPDKLSPELYLSSQTRALDLAYHQYSDLNPKKIQLNSIISELNLERKTKNFN